MAVGAEQKEQDSSMRECLFLDMASMEWERPFDGVQRKVLSGTHLTICLCHLKAGLQFPAHQHPQEQMAYIVKGSVEFTMGEAGEKRLFKEGMFFAPRRTSAACLSGRHSLTSPARRPT